MNFPPAASQASLVVIEPLQAKLRIAVRHSRFFVGWRQAQIHVRVPLRNAQRNARVEFVFLAVSLGAVYITPMSL